MSDKRWWKVTDSGGLEMFTQARSAAEAKSRVAYSFLVADEATEDEAIKFFVGRQKLAQGEDPS